MAKTVIENVKHDGRTCNKLVAFCDLEVHTSECSDMAKGYSAIQEKRMVFNETMPGRLVESKTEVTWDTTTFKHKNETFFLRMRKLANNYQLEMVMKGSKNDCHLFTTEISILDYESETAVFKTCFHPRPIDTEKWGTFCMLVPQDALARIWKRKEDDINYFKVAVKIKGSIKKV